jgi:hypothetical protein
MGALFLYRHRNPEEDGNCFGQTIYGNIFFSTVTMRIVKIQ